MGRDVPFDHAAVCDNCGAAGAFDFMGDYLCGACSQAALCARAECRQQMRCIWKEASCVPRMDVAVNDGSKNRRRENSSVPNED